MCLKALEKGQWSLIRDHSVQNTFYNVKKELLCLLIHCSISRGVRVKKTTQHVSFTFHSDLVLSSVGVSENLHMDGHLSHGVVHPGA